MSAELFQAVEDVEDEIKELEGRLAEQ